VRTGADRPFTVVFVSHSKEIGGTELHLEGLISSLRRAPVGGRPGQPLLICRRDSSLDTWAARIEASGVPVHRLDLNRPTDYGRLLSLQRGADLVHLMLAYPIGKYQLAAALISRLAKKRLIISHHLVLEIAALDRPRASRAGWNRLFRLYGGVASRHIAVSGSGRDLLTRVYGIPASQIEVIYTGVDAQTYAPLPSVERARVRAEVGVGSQTEMLVTTVARLSIQKGLDDLVDAAADVLRARSDVKFLLIGEGERRPELTQRIERHQLGERFDLAGERPATEVARLLASSDLFVLSSHFEGIPISLLEAMATGCPPIATAVGGVPEVVPDGAVGVLVEAARPAQLAAAIVRLLEQPALRSRIGEAARARVIARFDRAAGYARTLGLYAEVAELGG
jgi:glycosyltransferase involved in cell wall biosynthesis